MNNHLIKIIPIILLTLLVNINLLSEPKHISTTDSFTPINENFLNNKKSDSFQINIKKDKELAEILKDKYAIEKATHQDSVLTEINGFRVQVFTTDDWEKAKPKVEIYNEMFNPENVKMNFEEPYFKIRIGNLRDRDEAEQFKEKLANMGFRNLMIIPARVVVKMPKK